MPPHRRHLGVHELPRRRRARSRPGRPRGPHDDGRRRPAAGVPTREARGGRRVRLQARRAARRLAAAGHRREDILCVPPPAARHLAGDLVSVQRVRPHAAAGPQDPHPSRLGDPASHRGPRGARRLRRDRRPPAAEEPRGRGGRDARLRPVQRGLRRGHGRRSGCARHDRAPRDIRGPGGGHRLGARPCGGLDGRARAASCDRDRPRRRLRVRGRPAGPEGCRVVVHDRPGAAAPVAGERDRGRPAADDRPAWCRDDEPIACTAPRC